MDRISVIIRCKNEGKGIDRTLKSLFLCRTDQSYEVILVDSGSTDNTLDIAKRYDVKVFTIPESRFSYGYSLNYGIHNSSGGIICCLSAHCIPCHDDWLSELIKPIIDGTAHATYGRQVPVKGMNPFEELSLSRHFPEDGKPCGRVAFSNANCAFIRGMWEGTKFDERIPGWEDYLWHLLVKDKFIFQYAPNASVFHSHALSMSRIRTTAYNDGRAFRYIRENYALNVLGNISSMPGKFRYAARDIWGNIVFFLRNGYVGYVPIVPIVKLYSYMNYRKGYNK